MMRKPTSDADTSPIRVVVITLDGHLSSAVDRARERLEVELPGLTLDLHVAADWAGDTDAVERARRDISRGDIVIAHMLFMEDHISAVAEALEQRRDHCDAMIGCMSAESIVQLTRMGRLRLDGDESSLLGRLKGLRPQKKKASTPGARQAAMLRRIPQVLRFIPGTAQDMRAYFLTMQYWLAGSDENVAQMVRFLINRYAAGPRRGLRGRVSSQPPFEYPSTGLYHPRLPSLISEDPRRIPMPSGSEPIGTVGLLVMRSYVLAGNTAHYDQVIERLEARGMRVIPAFSSGLDGRPAVERYFKSDGRTCVDAVISLTGFSLVGGPAYNDARAAEELLAELDVPYLAAHAVEFQSLAQWRGSEQGLLPVESTMMVAIPELDGATGPMVFGGRGGAAAPARGAAADDHSAVSPKDMRGDEERIEMLAARVERLVRLRNKPVASRRVGIVLFNFPPGAGHTGTAMSLAVFESLHATLRALAAEGYTVDVPESVDALREAIVEGNAVRFGAHANVHARIDVDDHVRSEQWLDEIERQWGPAPGRDQSDGRSLFVLGARFGEVFVGVQPGFGYEGDPMRLLFEKGFAPTHAFSAFYRFLREDFDADVLLHFGTLEFMPGKQVGLTGDCWPDRLIGDRPNVYLYAANNPSEGTIAKRRGAATLVSYMTPPVAKAGLYRELTALKDLIERWRALEPDAVEERDSLIGPIQAQATAIDLVEPGDDWTPSEADDRLRALTVSLVELEETLVPYGLHVVGRPATLQERTEMMAAVAGMDEEHPVHRETIEALARGEAPESLVAGRGRRDAAHLERLRELAAMSRHLETDSELPALMRALDGRFIRPAPGGDLLATREILPTGRNVHGFDPFRMPSAFALSEGRIQAERLLDRHEREGHGMPESVALVLWGTDNLKSEGVSIAHALALIGARPRFDSYGRLAGAALISLEELGRPRIDVVMTLSGIFRDLFPLQTRLLAEACHLAAHAEEPSADNFVRKHALAHQAQHGCDLDTAALRVFSNAVGAYGANVSHLIQGELWTDEEELAETFCRRKSFAYDLNGRATQRPELFETVLAGVELTYQNLDSIDSSMTSNDVYFDNLGGKSRAVQRSGGAAVPVYIGDQTQGTHRVRTLGEQVALETRTRTLNPKWVEGMLEHGYEGVRSIEAHVTNTMGWSATTGQVAPWVYRQLAHTFVLDEAMRDRLAALNPAASAKVANRLLEAQERNYWTPDPEVLEALRNAGAELEDRLEGIDSGVAA